MKKIIALLVSMVMVIGGAGCGRNNHTHNFIAYKKELPTCTTPGTVKYLCLGCLTEKVEETSPALGHEMSSFVEASRITYCTREDCTYTQLAEGNGKYTETLAFTFDEQDKAILDAKYNELVAVFDGAESYDPARHGLTDEGAIAEAYAVAEKLYEEYDGLIADAMMQVSIAQTLYYCDYQNKAVEQRFNDMQSYYTELVAKFYSFSQRWYDSMYREFFFEGCTQEEIKAFLRESNAYADEEYTALKNRNTEIELAFNALEDKETGSEVPTLYAEFVANNTQIAEGLGYENYLEYAYGEIYGRDYTYQDAAQFVEYVKEYLIPIYNATYSKWNTIRSGWVSQSTLDTYYSVLNGSFFEDAYANKLFNDYIDDMHMAFTSNADKKISFSDLLNNLIVDGNMFRGDYEGAYVDYIYGLNLPIAYFGAGYDSASIVAHEFGHYVNAVYNEEKYDQSYDLCETHSQGQEMLFLHYMKNCLSADAFNLVETYSLLVAIETVVLSTQVDCFEQAIYLNRYEGPGANKIMADGKITADEYDAVYAGISQYLGIKEEYRVDVYWRYVTTSSPCYYISYAVSGVNALQIYARAMEQGFESAKESYLKLITYTDVDSEMTTEETLIYAGLTSYIDKQTFTQIQRCLG